MIIKISIFMFESLYIWHIKAVIEIIKLDKIKNLIKNKHAFNHQDSSRGRCHVLPNDRAQQHLTSDQLQQRMMGGPIIPRGSNNNNTDKRTFLEGEKKNSLYNK